MLRLLSSKAQGCKNFRKTSKPCHVGIHWIALAEYSQMSTYVPGFQSFFRFFASFCIGQINHWHMGTHMRVLSESFQMNTNMTWFRWFSKFFVSLCLDKSILSIGMDNQSYTVYSDVIFFFIYHSLRTQECHCEPIYCLALIEFIKKVSSILSSIYFHIFENNLGKFTKYLKESCYLTSG